MYVLGAFPPTCFGVGETLNQRWKRILCGGSMPLKVLCSLGTYSKRDSTYPQPKDR